MPYPTQTSREAIIATAYTLIERDGVEELTLAQLAEALGVKAPSLYRHVPNKAALIQQINVQTFTLLFDAYLQAQQGVDADPMAQLQALLTAHRAFAHDHPMTYVLAFTTTPAAERPSEAMLEQLVQPVQAIIAKLAGPKHALAALRGALALVHGFVMLELNQQLRREGDTTQAFEQSVEAYLRGWSLAEGVKG